MRIRTAYLLLAAGAAALLVALGIGIGYASFRTEAETPPQAERSDGDWYESPRDVVDALADHGISCTSYSEPVEDPIGALADGRCRAAGSEIVIRVHTDHAAALAETQMLLASTADLDLSEQAGVVGENWAVRGPREFAERVHEALGGELVEV